MTVLRLFCLFCGLSSMLFGADFCFRGVDFDVGIGASNYYTKFNQDENPTSTGRFNNGDIDFAAQFGVSGNWVCRCWYLGARAFAQYNAAEAKTERNTAPLQYTRIQKMPSDVGLEGRAGYIYRKWFYFFTALGADWGWNQYKEYGTLGGVDHKKVHVGLRVTGGGEQWLTKRIFMRESFGYTWFTSKGYIRPGGVGTTITPRLASTLFMLGMLF